MEDLADQQGDVARSHVELLLQAAQPPQSGWDTVRDWVSAVGSLGAALVAAIAFVWGLRGRRARAWAELSHPARRTVAWFETVSRPGQHSASGAVAAFPTPVAVVQNTSEEPIYDCYLSVNIDRQYWEEVGWCRRVEHQAMIPPGRTKIPMKGLNRRRQSQQLPAMVFTDSAGVLWSRGVAGKPLRRTIVHDSWILAGRRRHSLLWWWWRWRRQWWDRRRFAGMTWVIDREVFDEFIRGDRYPARPTPTSEPPSTDQPFTDQ
jgi:hypothetical protein